MHEYTASKSADRIRFLPEVSMVTEWEVKALSNLVSAQFKLLIKYY